MKAISNKTNLHVQHTGREKRLNFNLTGADFDINNSELDENQDYDVKEEENDNLNLGGDDFYREADEG